MIERLLVVGAREDSLGNAIAQAAMRADIRVTTAGLHDEQLRLDIATPNEAAEILEYGYPAVVCTAGVNRGGSFGESGFQLSLERHMEVNAIGPLRMLHYWIKQWRELGLSDQPQHFVAISSNSAHIARRNSGAYCASKSALSMGIRCAAREVADTPLNVWGVEPGWIGSTPMSRDVEARLDIGQSAHRIPGNRYVNKHKLADFIVEELSLDRGRFAGQMVRIDGGEQ